MHLLLFVDHFLFPVFYVRNHAMRDLFKRKWFDGKLNTLLKPNYFLRQTFNGISDIFIRYKDGDHILHDYSHKFRI